VIALDLTRFISFLFNLSVAGYFVYAFLFPEATGYWLAQGGFYVFIAEFLGIFVLLLLAQALGKKTGWTYSGDANPWLFIGVVMAMAFVFAWSLNALWAFGFFLISTVVKAFQIHHSPDAQSEGRQAVYSLLFLLLGTFGALFLSPLAYAFPHSVDVLSAVARSGGAEGLAVDNPGFNAIWGLIYFLGMAFVSLKPGWLSLEQAKSA